MSDAYAKVLDSSYSIRGRKIRAGQIVKLTTEQLAAGKASNPPHLEKVTKPEGDVPVIDIRPNGELLSSSSNESTPPTK